MRFSTKLLSTVLSLSPLLVLLVALLAGPGAALLHKTAATTPPPTTLEELAARGALFQVMSVHYFADKRQYVRLTILQDLTTGQRVRNVLDMGSELKTVQLPERGELFWVAGDWVRLRRRDDSALFWQRARQQ